MLLLIPVSCYLYRIRVSVHGHSVIIRGPRVNILSVLNIGAISLEMANRMSVMFQLLVIAACRWF